MSRGRKFHVHDPDDYCRIGDKVVIKNFGGVSGLKHYYVRNVVLPTGRHNYYSTGFSKDEKEAIVYNENLRVDFFNPQKLESLEKKNLI